jgi:hypothetical protein
MENILLLMRFNRTFSGGIGGLEGGFGFGSSLSLVVCLASGVTLFATLDMIPGELKGV